MDIRKVQLSGGSSFIVSLPREWIKSTGIKKNDPVGLIIQPDGTLLVTPRTDSEQVRKEKLFEVNTSTDETSFFRDLIGAYISGYTTITVRAEGRLSAFVIPRVRDFTSMAIGQEVVDETENSIILRDLLNPSEMPMDSTIRRMSTIVVRMHEDAVTALKTSDTALARGVMERDNDVDRLHWLIARQTNLIFHDVRLSRKMDIPPAMAAHYSQISKIVERIGDHATKIAGSSLSLEKGDVDNELLHVIGKAGGYALGIFRQAVNAFFEKDLIKANEAISKVPHLEATCREISRRSVAYDAAVAIHLVSISESIRRVGDYSADISEHAINSVVGEEG